MSSLLVLEQKLFDNCYAIAVGHSHLSVRAHNVVAATASLAKAGPARSYEPKDKSEVRITRDSFIECDIYRVVGQPSEGMARPDPTINFAELDAQN